MLLGSSGYNFLTTWSPFCRYVQYSLFNMKLLLRKSIYNILLKCPQAKVNYA